MTQCYDSIYLPLLTLLLAPTFSQTWLQLPLRLYFPIILRFSNISHYIKILQIFILNMSYDFLPQMFLSSYCMISVHEIFRQSSLHGKLPINLRVNNIGLQRGNYL